MLVIVDLLPANNKMSRIDPFVWTARVRFLPFWAVQKERERKRCAISLIGSLRRFLILVLPLRLYVCLITCAHAYNTHATHTDIEMQRCTHSHTQIHAEAHTRARSIQSYTYSLAQTCTIYLSLFSYISLIFRLFLLHTHSLTYSLAHRLTRTQIKIPFSPIPKGSFFFSGERKRKQKRKRGRVTHTQTCTHAHARTHTHTHTYVLWRAYTQVGVFLCYYSCHPFQDSYSFFRTHDNDYKMFNNDRYTDISQIYVQGCVFYVQGCVFYYYLTFY